MNPFSKELDKDSMLNIGSGKSASDETKRFLLSVGSVGEESQINFINECNEVDRFENEVIKRQKNVNIWTRGSKTSAEV